jgi:MYXO-CTERM domain-containing protein
MFDVNGDDTPTLTLIDSNGNDVGTTDYEFSGYSYGSTVYESASGMSRANGRASSAWEFEGVSFTLADFTGTGDSSAATGFRFSGDNGMDLGKVVAAIPEPHAGGLLLMGLAALAFTRRRARS